MSYHVIKPSVHGDFKEDTLENFTPIPGRREKVLTAGSDRRKPMEQVPEIVMLRIKTATANEWFMGTGTIICSQSFSDSPSFVVLTAAHNVVEIGPNGPVDAKTVSIKLSNDVLVTALGWRYFSDFKHRHDPYHGTDIAIVFFPSKKLHYIKSKAILWPYDKERKQYHKDCFATAKKKPKHDLKLQGDFFVTGFPGEKNAGKLMGMKGSGLLRQETIKYPDIDTSSGQSGSPIYYHNKNNKIVVMGVHAGFSVPCNIATALSPAHLEFISECCKSAPLVEKEYTLNLQIDELHVRYKEYRMNENVIEAKKIKKQLGAKKKDLEVTKNQIKLSISKSTSHESIKWKVVVEEKEKGWKPGTHESVYDCSKQYQYSVSQAKDAAEKGKIKPGNFVYVLSRRLEKWHKIESIKIEDKNENQIREDIDSLEKDLAELKEKIDQSASENDYITAGKLQEELKTKESDLQMEKQKLGVKSPFLREKTKSSPPTTTDFPSKEGITQNQITTTTTTTTTTSITEEKIDFIEAECIQLEISLQLLDEDLKQSVATKNFALSATLQSKMKTLKSELERKRNEKEQVSSSITTITQDKSNMDLKEYISHLKKEIASLNAARLSINTDLNNKRKNNPDDLESVAILERKMEEKNKEIIIKKKDLKESQKQLSQEKKEKAINELEKKNIKIQSELDAAISDKRYSTAAELDKQLDKNRRSILESKKKNLEPTAKPSLDRSQTPEITFVMAGNKNETLRKQVDLLEKECKTLEDQLNKYASKGDYENAGKLQQKIQEKKKKIAGLKSENL